MAIDFPDSPTVDQQYSVGDRTWTWNGTYWQLSQTSSTFTASDTAPVNPSAGDIWFESDTGQTFVYYDQSWVEIGAATDLSDILSDADADTSIQVEASSDEDVIRFRTAGTERLHLTSDGHLIPQANVTYDLGSASNRFRDLYLSGSSIDLGGVEITSDGTNISLPNVDDVAANTVTANSVQIGGEYVSSYSGRKNYIYNGSFQVAQRGASVSTLSGYTLDRWRIDVVNPSYTAGVSGTIQQVDDAGYAMSVRSGSTAPGFFMIEQRFEGRDVAHLAGRTVTFSFKVKRVSTTVTQGTIRVHHDDDLGGSLRDETNIATVKGDISNISTSAYEQYSTSYTFPATVTASGYYRIGIYFYGMGGITTSSEMFRIKDVQLEEGSVATPFEHRSFGEELALCQRYYEKNTYNLSTIWSGDVTSGSTYYNSERFRVLKRASPTMTASMAVWINFSSAVPSFTISADGYTAGKSATGTGIGRYVFTWTASAEL